MFKRKTDEKHIKIMEFNFSMCVDVDSSLDDEEIPSEIMETLKNKFSSPDTKIVINRVIRSGEGVIEKIDIKII